MPIPLPEFLRNYGDLLRSESTEPLRALLWAVAVVVLLLVVFLVGGAVHGLLRFWRRENERRGHAAR